MKPDLMDGQNKIAPQNAICGILRFGCGGRLVVKNKGHSCVCGRHITKWQKMPRKEFPYEKKQISWLGND